jgi:hypothetical protein
MKRWFIPTLLLVGLLLPQTALPAEVTEVLDAADGDDPIDINLDVGFRSMLNRSKITHEASWYWQRPGYSDRPDFNELRFEQQVYAMDYTFQIGLYHDVELYANLPWIIQDKRSITWVSGVSNTTSTLYQLNPTDPDYPGNALAMDPTDNPSSKRSGIGDIQIGFKWAAFNDERDDTKSVWIIGLDYTIPSGKLAQPKDVAAGAEGNVGLGQHVITPFMLFSHRFKVLDPYLGLHGSIPVQGREAKNAGFEAPYWGGFLVGMEIIPWENKDKHQKFAIDVRLTTDFFSEVESKGRSKGQGYVTGHGQLHPVRPAAGLHHPRGRVRQAALRGEPGPQHRALPHRSRLLRRHDRRGRVRSTRRFSERLPELHLRRPRPPRPRGRDHHLHLVGHRDAYLLTQGVALG